MTPAQIEEIEARVARATPGPWISVPAVGFADTFNIRTSRPKRRPSIAFTSSDSKRAEADAALIAHAPTDLLALLAALKEARAEIDAAVARERERAASEADDEADDATERLKLPGANISALKATIRTAHRIAAAIRAGDGAREG